MPVIEVRTQRIVVFPSSGKIDIIGYGVAGPPGPQGEVVTSSTPPSNPPNGLLWYHTEDGTLLIHYDGTWVETSNPGPIGPQGIPGPPGSGSPSYVHSQGVASAIWSVVHNLSWFPNVTVIDSSGSTVEGDITHLSSSQLTLTFSGAFTGVAYLS